MTSVRPFLHLDAGQTTSERGRDLPELSSLLLGLLSDCWLVILSVFLWTDGIFFFFFLLVGWPADCLLDVRLLS